MIAFRILGALAAGCAASFSAVIVFWLIMLPFNSFESEPVFHYGSRAVDGLLRGFAFVFVGAVVACRPCRARAAFGLLPVGVGLYIYGQSYAVSNPFPVWHFTACVAGGLLAVAIHVWRERRRGQRLQATAAPHRV